MLPLTIEYMQRLSRATACGWNRFWFAPQDPATLGLIRILAGAMLLYTHLARTLRLDEFFGADAWVSPEAAASAAHGCGVDVLQVHGFARPQVERTLALFPR